MRFKFWIVGGERKSQIFLRHTPYRSRANQAYLPQLTPSDRNFTAHHGFANSARHKISPNAWSNQSMTVERMRHAPITAIVGVGTSHGKAAIAPAKNEEGKANGATVPVDSARATRCGGAFANSRLEITPS
jgi:hypothetical protein